MAEERRVAATAALVGVTVVWGSTFVVVKDSVERMPVLDFLAWRFVAAALVMFALRPRAVARLGPHARRNGCWLGAALAAGYVAQTFGLERTTASVSGFITGLFVVLTPLFAAIVVRRRVTPAAWGAAGLAALGLALLSLHGLSVGTGEALTLLCAAAFAAHIVGLGEWSTGASAYGLAVVQLAVVGLVCTLGALPGGVARPPDGATWAALALTSLAATAVGFLVQTWAQAHLAATRTAVVLTLEPVFAGLFGVLAAGDPFGPRTAAGAGCVLVAMLLVEARPTRRVRTVPRLEV